jgi:hypothetical protein
MKTQVTINYCDPASGAYEIIQGIRIGEDDKYLYLDCGQYRKKFITSYASDTIYDDDED